MSNSGKIFEGEITIEAEADELRAQEARMDELWEFIKAAVDGDPRFKGIRVCGPGIHRIDERTEEQRKRDYKVDKVLRYMAPAIRKHPGALEFLTDLLVDERDRDED